MSVKITGLDKLMQDLEDLSQKASAIDGQNNVPLEELFPCHFMLRYTDFNSIEHMLDKSGYNIRSQKDLDNIPSDEWDDYISKNTRFNTWNEMMSAAGKEWVTCKLGFE